MKVAIEIGLVTRSCPICGIDYAVPEGWLDERQKDHALFYCPNGHPRYFPAKNKEELLQEQLTHVKTQLDRVEQDRIRIIREYDNLQRRITAGVCPKCHRHFTNVERHMKAKHS